MNRRCDPMARGTLLSAALEVVSPSAVDNIEDIISVVSRWEAKFVGLKESNNQEVGSNFRIANMAGMVPKSVK